MIIKIYKLEELTLLGKKYSGDFLDDKNHINQDLTKCYLLEISNLTKLEMTAQLDRYAYGLDYAEKKQATSSLTQKSFVDMVTEPSSKTSQCLLL